MKKNRIAGFFVFVFMASLLFLPGDSFSLDTGKRKVELLYKFKVKGTSENVGKMARVWVPYPPDNKEQRVVKARIVKSPVKAELKRESEWGNSMFYFEVPLKKRGFTFSVEYIIERDEVRVPLSMITDDADTVVFSQHLKPSVMAVHNERIVRYSKMAVKDKSGVLGKARGVYDFVLTHMEYNKKIPGWGKGDVNRVCLSVGDDAEGVGTGNCTDFHSFFSSLMQVQSIPVVFEMGFPLTLEAKRKRTVKGGYHCWAKFYAEGVGWVPVDISEADKDDMKKDYYFGSIDANRILLSVGRDIALNPRQVGGALNYFGPDPYIELDGKPYDSFERSISYRDI